MKRRRYPRLVSPVDRPVNPPEPDADAEPIGRILVDLRRISAPQVDQVLQRQVSADGRRFGEIAVALGFVTAEDIGQALARQRAARPWPERPPAPTRRVASLLDAESNETLVAVRSQLIHRWFGSDAEQRSLAIVSVDRADGRSYVASHLARLFAALDDLTLLIDADLRHPQQHRLFGMDNACGLSSYLAGDVDVPPVRAVPGVSHLHLLPSGPPPPDPHLLLSSRRFGALLEEMTERYAFVLLDTSATRLAGDACTVALRASGALIVTAQHRSRTADVQALARRLSDATVEVVGAVINAAS